MINVIRRNWLDCEDIKANNSLLNVLFHFFWFQMPVPKIYDGNSFYNSNCGRSIKDSKANFPMSKQMNKCHALPENNLLKGLLTDKEKSAAAAKIKVVVCYCLVLSTLLLCKHWVQMVHLISGAKAATKQERDIKERWRHYSNRATFKFPHCLWNQTKGLWANDSLLNLFWTAIPYCDA